MLGGNRIFRQKRDKANTTQMRFVLTRLETVILWEMIGTCLVRQLFKLSSSIVIMIIMKNIPYLKTIAMILN